jgi:hypothetical protein
MRCHRRSVSRHASRAQRADLLLAHLSFVAIAATIRARRPQGFERADEAATPARGLRERGGEAGSARRVGRLRRDCTGSVPNAAASIEHHMWNRATRVLVDGGREAGSRGRQLWREALPEGMVRQSGRYCPR